MNGKMTRYFLLVLTLLLAVCCAASAQNTSVTQIREQAAQGWHQTYQAYGNTVTVDIPVQVPDANQYPVLKAGYLPPLTNPIVSDWADAVLFQDTGFFRLDSHSSQTRQKAESKSSEEPPSGMDVHPIYKEINELTLDTAYAYDNPATVGDAAMMMETVWAENFPNDQVEFSPYAVYATGEMRFYDDNMEAFYGDPWPYQGVLMVYFHQIIGNVPVLCRGESCFGNFSKAPAKVQTMAIGATAILQKMPDDDSMFYSAQSQYTLLKSQEVLTANLPLCGLDQVTKTYERLIADGLLRQVYSLRLGYVAWQTGNDSFTLIPTWVLTGDVYADAETPTQDIRQNADPRTREHGIILVNAKTGELIDPVVIDIGSLYP